MSSPDPVKFLAKAATALAVVLSSAQIASARPEGVNRPDLLPKEKTTVIDVANFLSKGQERKIQGSIAELEKATGIKLRLLCQSYPNTPGLAIKEFWGIDDNTVLLVADRGEGFNRKGIPTNMLNFNIGANVENVLSNQFWTRVTNKLGNQPYIKKNGEDVALLNAVEAITFCLQSKDCVDLPFQVQQ
ncbi:hypothetical protein B484DRAFT_334442 [Ochromonadaceae sp. CCMP2298]|nr:hypothetical protein B484DRAFT_334442 [Ochromonadaceae sp. CCMP2298]